MADQQENAVKRGRSSRVRCSFCGYWVVGTPKTILDHAERCIPDVADEIFHGTREDTEKFLLSEEDPD